MKYVLLKKIYVIKLRFYLRYWYIRRKIKKKIAILCIYDMVNHKIYTSTGPETDHRTLRCDAVPAKEMRKTSFYGALWWVYESGHFSYIRKLTTLWCLNWTQNVLSYDRIYFSKKIDECLTSHLACRLWNTMAIIRDVAILRVW